MSLDLTDLRLKITPETSAWLQAKARVTGLTQQEIARDALHSVAVKEIHDARVLVSLAPPKV